MNTRVCDKCGGEMLKIYSHSGEVDKIDYDACTPEDQKEKKNVKKEVFKCRVCKKRKEEITDI